ncbi:MAG: DMT family transporter [Desulfosarcina sp.]|nr:DMT family transporter [Desulfobacterales bacterium]
MNTRTARADVLLLLTAIIWGFAFVAQRVGMEFVGPFTFNGVRFALGSLSLVPLLFVLNRRAPQARRVLPATGLKTLLSGGGLAGLFLFAGASLQQVGLVYTTAGNAGFITGLYVVIVPIMGLALRQSTTTGTWLGALLAAAGLYFLSITEQFTIAWGDLLEVIGAFFWAAHVLIIGRLSPRMDALKLAITQFAVCAVLSLVTALAIETITWEGLRQAAIPILYGGLGSVGVAYTLQVVAQKDAPPAHAAIFLSMEAVFAAWGGWLLLREVLTARAVFGCGLMLAGMLLSQLWGFIRRKH